MKEIPFAKFNPHPSEVAINFTPVSRPSLAFSTSELFHNEMHVLLLCMRNSRATSFENIIHYSRQKYLDNDISDDLAQVVLYHIIQREYAYEGNADNVWNEQEGYANLLKFPAIQIVMNWVIWAMFSQSSQFLQRNAKDLTITERKTDLTFLFERTGVSLVNHGNQGYNDNLLVGQIANLSHQMSTMTSVMDRTFQRLEREAASHEEPAATPMGRLEAPNEEDLIDPTNLSLDQLVCRAFEGTNDGIPMPVESYSTYWTAPPPISLTNMYSMEKLSDASKSFLIDGFLDIYNGQLTLLSVHFYLRRMIALWKNTDSVVESALFSKEMQFLKLTLSSFAEKMGNQFSLKFLAMEGISLTGAKNIEILERIFPAPGVKGAIKPVIDIGTYLEGVIETVRDCCVGLDRLRVSLLYGRDHPSYIGDDFLTSYLYRSYITRHAGSAMETIMAVTPALANMTLPMDQKKNVEFYNGLFGHSLDGASQRFVVEPEMRQHFNEKLLDLVGGTQSSGKSRSMPVTGEIESLFPATPEGKMLLGLVEDMWEKSAFLTTLVDDPEPIPEDATTEIRILNESLVPEE